MISNSRSHRIPMYFFISQFSRDGRAALMSLSSDIIQPLFTTSCILAINWLLEQSDMLNDVILLFHHETVNNFASLQFPIMLACTIFAHINGFVV